MAEAASVSGFKDRVRPEVLAASKRVVVRERDVLDYLAAYDRGEVTDGEEEAHAAGDARADRNGGTR
jgi:hypothetical protein